MRHFPVFLDLRGQYVAVVGGGQIAVAKLRLLLKTEAHVTVHAVDACAEIRAWHDAGRLVWNPAPFTHVDAVGACLVYAATGSPDEDAEVKRIAEPTGALVNVVDDLEASDFITPAIVDRDPVTVAIGTEGTAPVLARRIKAETEARLSPQLGVLARTAARFRGRAEALPAGSPRRTFWARFFGGEGARAHAEGGEAAVSARLESLLGEALAQPERRGHVALVGAGPGDPELLTLKARRLLDEADVVIYDRLVTPGALELARREARLIEVGKTPGGPSWRQADIDAEMIRHAHAGALVVRLKSGDPLVFGRADEELEALHDAGVEVSIVPGVTAATAAAAGAGVSLTRRGRNTAVGFITAHDARGFAEHDWRALAMPNAVFAVYMGVRASRFLQGRLLLHGARSDTPVTVVENASQANETIASGTLADLPAVMREAGITGPAIIFVGLAPAAAASMVPPAHLDAAIGAAGGA